MESLFKRISNLGWKLSLKVATGVVLALLAAAWWFVKSHPLVFNESWTGHRHCMNMWGLAIRLYADDHGGVYPTHPAGYGAAIQLLYSGTNVYMGTHLVMGAPGGYRGDVFEAAWTNMTVVREEDCGRVYVQGLRESSNPKVAMLWDKRASPGDHAHGWMRLRVPWRREVCLVDGSMQQILEKDWPEFMKEQIELLVTEGIPRERAEALYAEKPKPLK
jgi:hypothetical protein